MRVAINLATRPYVELGPIYQRLRIAIAALALLALPLWLLLRVETKKASKAHAQLAAAQQDIERLQRQQQGYQADMLQPQNASVLRQSQFLNKVFARKAFSWTAVMMDLENVLPSGVQVLNIDPVIASNGDVTIRLRVSGQRDRAVELVRNLEHSRRFLFPRLAGETAETTAAGGRGMEPVSSGGVDFELLAEYNPLPTSAPETQPDKNSPPEEKKTVRTNTASTAHTHKMARPITQALRKAGPR
ncbi:MAG TPA: fimbrial assembly protein [Acidobacteriaceae bacterium]|jgi:type IV pilus assembly protein PilN